MHSLGPILRWLLLVPLLGLHVWCFAQDHITERAWLEDPSGQMSWEEVRDRRPQPYVGILNKRVGASAIWLRLRIDPSLHSASNLTTTRLVLRIRPPFLDDIRVYDPLVPGGLAGRTGDLQHPREAAMRGLDLLVPIARGSEPREVWLRLTSESMRVIDVQALDRASLDRATLIQNLLFGVGVAFTALFAVWGMTSWLFNRERLMGLFGLGQATALLQLLSSLGYLRMFWPGDWSAEALHGTTNFFTLATVSVATLFHVLFLSQFDPPPWLRRVHWAMVGLFPVKLGLMVAGLEIAAMRLNMIELQVSVWIYLTSVFLCRAWSAGRSQPIVLARFSVVLFYAALVASLFLASLVGLGLLGGAESALHAVQAHGLVTGLLLLLLLQYRARTEGRQRRETLMALERSLLQTQLERNLREEQEKLLAMLAHELRTPLATMHMRLDSAADGTAAIKHAIRDMNAVIERCLQTSQLGDRQLRARVEPLDAVGVAREAIASCPQPTRIEIETPTDILIESDRQLLFIVMSNLLENACKYAAPGSPIRLCLARANNGDLQLEIANAPGAAGWPDAAKLFEKYYRSPHARRQAGTGLGLFLVRNLTQVLGGRIYYQPDAAMIRFRLRLPKVAPIN